MKGSAAPESPFGSASEAANRPAPRAAGFLDSRPRVSQETGVGRRWIRAGVAVVVVGLLAGACASRGPTFGFKPDRAREQQIEHEYAPYRQRGSGAIFGQAWLTLPGGQRVLANRRAVKLTPVTSVSRLFIDEAMKSGDWSTQVLARDRAVVWSTRTTEDGSFGFNQLPAGDYYIIAHAGWTDATGHPQETILVLQVTLSAGEERNVALAGSVPTLQPPPPK